MNQRLYAEFTALVATQAPLAIEGQAPLSDGPLWVYWQHSQAALRRWRKTIEAAPDKFDPRAGREFATVASAVLVSEMLTRVWGAVLTACDEHRQHRQAAPIARSVLTAHQQCRINVLQTLVHSPSFPMEQLADLDRLRRRVERWTDLLLGPLVVRYGDALANFAFDARRAKDFGNDQFQTYFHSASRPAWSFLLAGLRTAFPEDAHGTSPVADVTLPILRSVLTHFPNDAFQDAGPIKSLRLTRAARSGQQPDRTLTSETSAGFFRADVFAAQPHRPASPKWRNHH